MLSEQKDEVISIFVGLPSIKLFQQFYQLISVQYQFALHNKSLCCPYRNEKLPLPEGFDIYDSSLERMFEFSSSTVSQLHEENSLSEGQKNKVFIPLKARCILIDSNENGSFTQKLITQNYSDIFSLIDEKNILIQKDHMTLSFDSIQKDEEYSFFISIKDRIRAEMEKCNSIDGFFLYSASGDKSSSLLSSFLLQYLKTQFEEIKIMSFVVHPDLSYKEGVSFQEEACNSTILHKYLNENANVVHCFDQQKLEILCQRNLKIDNPTDVGMNRLLSHQIQNITWNFYEKLSVEQNCPYPHNIFSKVHEIDKFFAPFHNIKYTHSIFAPILPKALSSQISDQFPTRIQAYQLINSMVTGDLSMCNFDHTSYRNLNISFTERGKTKRYDINTLINYKSQRLLNFVDWSYQNQFRFDLINRPTIRYLDENLLHSGNEMSIVANNAGIVESFYKFFSVCQKNSLKKYYGQSNNIVEQSIQSMRSVFDDYEEASMETLMGYSDDDDDDDE